jgi:hypothetical protein
MRELTKSFLSFSWAMSLLGVKQATGLLSPGRSNDCEAVAQAAANQLSPTLQGLFRAGDSIQRGMVNAMFGFLEPGSWNPSRWTPASGEAAVGGQPGVSGTTGMNTRQSEADCCTGNPSQGWGPVTPPTA